MPAVILTDWSGGENDQTRAPCSSPAMIRTQELTCSSIPTPSPNGKKISEPLKLPSLNRRPQNGTPMVPLSISEPSLFVTDQRICSERFSHNWRPSQRQHSCRVWVESDGLHQAYRPVYTQFSQPLHPLPRPNEFVSTARWPTTSQRVLRPLVKQRQQHQCKEDLSIRGTPCIRPATSRKQLHIFLPAEGTTEEDDRDSESIDEGFMDEVEHKGNKQPVKPNPPTGQG